MQSIWDIKLSLRLRSQAHDNKARATSMFQLKTKKSRITKNNKYDEYKKIIKHKQEHYCCAYCAERVGLTRIQLAPTRARDELEASFAPKNPT